ncbi:MAG: aminopeptidase N [Actinomycetes bacterium]
MTANNLKRDEARERARLIANVSYDVALDLTDGAGSAGEETFRSTTVARFACVEPGATTFIDLIASSVREVVLNGAPLDPSTAYDDAHGRIVLPSLSADNELRVVTDCAYMRTGEGLHRFVDPVDKAVYLYSQFETADAHRMYTCFDQPDLKATFQLEVVAPNGWQVVSTMPTPDATAVDDRVGIDRWQFAASPPLSPYVTSLIAGPYHRVDDVHQGRGGEIPLGLFCRESLAEHLDADELFELTKRGFAFFEDAFGAPYPFAKYDQLFVPEFNAGAMENASAVTFLEDYVFRSKVTAAAYERRAVTLLHEMAHMWFGDLVTMRWWDDLWLNESFAEYVSTLATELATKYDAVWASFANVEKTWAYRQDQLPSTHPIAADIVDLAAVRANFDGITYAKGASVLKQLVAWVGRDEFLAGCRDYFERHAWGNTTLLDLLGALEQTSGRDLSSWSKEWLETAGVNTLRASFDEDDRVFTSFSVVQEAPEQHPTLRSHRIAIGLYDQIDGGLVRRDRVEVDISGATSEVSELVGVRRPDLVLLNDDDLTYAKIRLDERSLATVTQHIGLLPHPLTRAICWAAAWDMLRDAEMPTRDYVALVTHGIGGEADIGLLQNHLRQAKIACDSFADPQWRDEGLRLLAQAAYEHAQAAEPGSDHQLAWVRALAMTAVQPEQLDLIAGLLSGGRQINGLRVDVDLRWALLTRLVIVGRAGEEEIEAEVARDRTATGERQAAMIRAAAPTAEAKAQAWAAVVERDELPNALQRATVAGFQQADQLPLLTPYVEHYFDAIGEIWQSRTPEMAQDLVVGLFPSLVISDATMARTDEWLRTAGPEPTLRRLVVEGRDTMARAMRARACDSAANQPAR